MTGSRSASSGDAIRLPTATSLAIANMIGTGVFTSLGFQLVDLRDGFALLALWVVGGLSALCGALTYGELAAAMPRSGGELHFLSRLYHPAVGFLAGWVSVSMGFALPIALAAMAFGSYFARVAPETSAVVTSCALVVAVTLAHLRDLRLGSVFQNVFTAFKLILIVVFVVAAAHHAVGGAAGLRWTDFAPSSRSIDEITSGAFAVSLLYVMYAYAGWNASVYVIDEIDDPGRVVPRSLLLSAAIVTILYTALNAAFLSAAPADEMVGQIDVGHLAAARIFGDDGGRLMSGLLCIALISTISAMVWAGPRVTQVIGQDYAVFRPLARTNRRGVPVVAILTQTALVLVLLVTASFQSLLVYTQFALALSSGLAVLGVFVLRRRDDDRPSVYRTWGYPFTPLLFLAITIGTLGFTLIRHPWESVAGLLTILLGLPIYWLSPKTADHPTSRPAS
ncbi:MAG: amino acid permease [Acidobacteriota bacterium]